MWFIARNASSACLLLRPTRVGSMLLRCRNNLCVGKQRKRQHEQHAQGQQAREGSSSAHLARSPWRIVCWACRSAVHTALLADRLLLLELPLAHWWLLPAAAEPHLLPLLLLPLDAVAAALNCCASRLRAGPRMM